MKKKSLKQVNLNLPAFLFGFTRDSENENFSRGQLKVFYEGTTPDGRYFSHKFSQQLIKTLPYSPIVSYCDEEKDDFVGHAPEQQILGIVDPMVEPHFETDEDGVTWCICSTVYYTERPDKVGEWAKKIEGHSQSLELDPNSVEYVINYDEKKHFKNIEFTAGKFCGISVLGENQRPAFTGSAFFTENAFEEKMEILRNYCENKEKTTGGNKMDFNQFLELSWGEKSCKVAQAVSKEYENDAYTFIVDMYDDSAIVQFYYYLENTQKLMRVNYSLGENGEVTLGDVKEVHVTYSDVVAEGTTPSFENEAASTNEATGEGQTENVVPTETQEQFSEAVENTAEGNVAEEQTEQEEQTETNFEAEQTSEETSEEDPVQTEASNVSDTAEFTQSTETETEEASVENNESQSEQSVQEEENTSSTAFTESERAELESLKREKKVALINSFKDVLDEEVYNDFISNIDNFASEEILELQLLREEHKSVPKQTSMRAFSITNIAESAEQGDPLDSLVTKYLKKEVK